MLKMAVLAPMPSANVAIAAAANPGRLRSDRSPNRVSCSVYSTHRRTTVPLRDSLSMIRLLRLRWRIAMAGRTDASA